MRKQISLVYAWLFFSFFLVEEPHRDIYAFQGNITWLPMQVTESLSVENTLWMNTVLASQGYVIALVVYTGSETRAVMNTSFPSTKVGLLDLEINQLSKVCLFLLIIKKILAIVTLSLSFAMVSLNGFQGLWFVQLIRFLILFSSIIPISLRVNLDMGKTVYSHMINTDNAIPGTIVRTSTIPEELGRIEYLLVWFFDIILITLRRTRRARSQKMVRFLALTSRHGIEKSTFRNHALWIRIL